MFWNLMMQVHLENASRGIPKNLLIYFILLTTVSLQNTITHFKNLIPLLYTINQLHAF